MNKLFIILSTVCFLFLANTMTAQDYKNWTVQAQRSISAQDPVIRALAKEIKGEFSLSEGEKIDMHGTGRNSGKDYTVYVFPQRSGKSEISYLTYTTLPGQTKIDTRKMHQLLMSIVRSGKKSKEFKLEFKDMNGNVLGGGIYESTGPNQTDRFLRSISSSNRNAFTDCLSNAFSQLPGWLQWACNSAFGACMWSLGQNLPACGAAIGCAAGYVTGCAANAMLR